jgi:hypothetical protein
VVDRLIVCDRRGEQRGNDADQLDADKLSHRLLSDDFAALCKLDITPAFVRFRQLDYSDWPICDLPPSDRRS